MPVSKPNQRERRKHSYTEPAGGTESAQWLWDRPFNCRRG